MTTQTELALAAIAANPFSKSPSYRVDFDIRRLRNNLDTYHPELLSTDTLKDMVQKMTPGFQRDNNKWTYPQKQRFIENLISGCRSEITLYSLAGDASRCYILDGLQRLTAVAGFICEDFTIWGGLRFSEIADPLVFTNGKMSLRIYDFSTEEEAISFYIAMNEGITHSPEDIARARRFLPQAHK